MQFFYIMKVVFFYKRVHISFISIIFEAKVVILPFLDALAFLDLKLSVSE